MLGRRVWLKSALVAVASWLPMRRAKAQEGNSFNSAERLPQRNTVDLEDQLRNGLRVVTPGQLQFVRLVVLSVNQGRLPRAMVNFLYKWALERNPKVPFPYFQFAMRALARRRGVNLP